MAIFDFFRKKGESKEENKPDSRQGRAAQNPVSRERDKEQATSDRVSAASSDKSFKPKNRPPAPSHEYYEVQNGDSLSGIAKDRYGDAEKWKIIYEANKNKIKDPDLIEPGQVIELPNIHKGK
jgi:nucleoid-associated protein YgaU